MKTGLLWYDDNPTRDLADKINRAAHRYEQKFGTVPDICYIHPSALSDNGKMKKVGDVIISSRRTVLRHHFWIGQEEKKREQPKR